MRAAPECGEARTPEAAKQIEEQIEEGDRRGGDPAAGAEGGVAAGLDLRAPGSLPQYGGRMGLLHVSKDTLRGTAYFEFLPGRYRGNCWTERSVFLDEEAFGYIEPIFLRQLPDYDHYAFVEVARPRWLPILAELDGLVGVLRGRPDDRTLAEVLGFYFADTQRKFFEDRDGSVAAVEHMASELSAWLRRVLQDEECVSVLGL